MPPSPQRRAYRIALALAAGAGLLLLWANGAVGVIGNEDNPVNLLFVGVVLVGVVGSLSVRFRPAGMARTMYATAAALAAVAVYLAVSGHGLIPVVTLVFGGAWVAAGRLFARSAAIVHHPSDTTEIREGP